VLAVEHGRDMSLSAEEADEKAKAKEAKRQRLRAHSIKELVVTEGQYVADLETLTEVYITPLATNAIINAEQHRLLFNNIPALIKLNKQFKEGLDAIYKEWDPLRSQIAPEFLQFAPYFHMYQGYLNSHEQAAGLVSKLYVRSSKFKKFCDAAQSHPKCKGLDIKSFLVKPLQRITKYSLLLRELIKHTLPSHPDYEQLQQAMAKINAVNTAINENMKTFDQRQKVRDIQARFTQNVDLVSPARYFIKEGKLTKICRKRDIAYIFILFSDLLIYGETSSSEKASASSQIKIHQQIPINQSFRIRDIPQNIKYGAKCWEIHSPTKSFIVYADHPGLKHEWYGEMEKVVNARNTIVSGKQRPAALWVPDDFTTHCMMDDCDHKFNVLNRRHHCRYCGRLVCGPCSTNKLPHWTKHNKTVRVCNMCFAENKNVRMGHSAQSSDVLDDEDSMSAGSEIDFQFWDSDDEDDGPLIPLAENDDSMTHSNSDPEKKGSGAMPIKAMTIRKKKTERKKKKHLYSRSQSVGDDPDFGVSRNNTNRGIFHSTAKVFRLQYEDAPKRGNRSTILYELEKDKSFTERMNSLKVGGGAAMRTASKRDSQSISVSLPNASTPTPAVSADALIGALSPIDSSPPKISVEEVPESVAMEPLTSATTGTETVDEFDDDEKSEKKQCGSFEKEAVKAVAEEKSNLSLSVSTQMAKPLLSNNISMSMSGLGGASPRSEGAHSKRLRLVGTGTLNLEAHPYDHELVSMRLTTFNEVIHWNMEPFRMKPKKKDDTSLYLKATNALTHRSEILLIQIKSKDIIDSLMTILLSLQFYYEAENKNRDDDDMDSDLDDEESDSKSGGGDEHTISLAADSTMTEHKAEIDRAVFLIENSKKHDNIKTVDIAKFLVAKSCPLSVIEHAFSLAAVPMPPELYEMTGTAAPQSRSQKRLNGKSDTKRAKLLAIGLQRHHKSSPNPLELTQSESENAEDENWWSPPETVLAVADQDRRYQEALCQHDIRFCTIHTLDGNGQISSVLPSDKLDQQLRLRINRMAARSGNTILSSDMKKVKTSKKRKWRQKFKGRSSAAK